MVKRTHLDLSVKCGSTPTRPRIKNGRELGCGVQFPFSIVCNHIFIAAAVHMTKMCSIICFILQAAELRLNQDALLNKREWGILFSENNKRAEGCARGLKYKSVKISYNATRPNRPR